jgi:hypothetical protein
MHVRETTAWFVHIYCPWKTHLLRAVQHALRWVPLFTNKAAVCFFVSGAIVFAVIQAVHWCVFGANTGACSHAGCPYVQFVALVPVWPWSYSMSLGSVCWVVGGNASEMCCEVPSQNTCRDIGCRDRFLIFSDCPGQCQYTYYLTLGHGRFPLYSSNFLVSIHLTVWNNNLSHWPSAIK